MKVDIDELERKAMAATQEAWHWGEEGLMAEGLTYPLLYAHQFFPGTECAPEVVSDETTMAHIAAASPPVVLALIARIRELEATLQDASELAEDHGLPASAAIYAEVVRKGAVLP